MTIRLADLIYWWPTADYHRLMAKVAPASNVLFEDLATTVVCYIWPLDSDDGRAWTCASLEFLYLGGITAISAQGLSSLQVLL
jgi:hypothetical protein